MQSGKSITELSTPKRIQTHVGDQQAHLEYGPEHDALVSLANETFGLYGWSHSVTHQNIDYIDCNSSKYSVGVAAFVKVELKNGIQHQDVGYGMCKDSCSKGYAIAHARKEATTNGLREALRSFGCHFTGKVNECAGVRVESSVLKTSVQMDKHCLIHAVPGSSTHTTGASPRACMQSADDITLERKRRQRMKRDEFLQQLKEKQLSQSKDLQTKSLVDKDTGIRHKEEKESTLMNDETLISTQELDHAVQSAEIQLGRTPLLCSPPIAAEMTPPWPSDRGSRLMGNTVIPRQLVMPSRRTLP
ncbi:uncharacterized protein LOC111863274 isoform X2 [Cryptotermes secundus]|nr:uncharacterized protein LOC111863274 isoform X2 [Cryptotermes secundus]